MIASHRKTKRRCSSSEEGAVMPKMNDAPRNRLARALITFPCGRLAGIRFGFGVTERLHTFSVKGKTQHEQQEIEGRNLRG
jgi:hypothetical protein